MSASSKEAIASRAAELVAERERRLMSINALSKLTGFDRGTIDAWITKGCPVEKSGGKGDEYQFDIARV